jgi:hypothetical protein
MLPLCQRTHRTVARFAGNGTAKPPETRFGNRKAASRRPFQSVCCFVCSGDRLLLPLPAPLSRARQISQRSASAAWDSPALIRSRCTFRPTNRRTSSDMGIVRQDRKKPITGIAGCCARAASGHTTADPVITLMKSRRRIAFTKAGTTPNSTRLQQGFGTGEMGFRGQFAAVTGGTVFGGNLN